MLVNYRFTGFLDEVYATLVVRLHHTKPFERDGLWRHGADFKTILGKQLGLKLTRRAQGVGELEVYFDPAVAMEQKIIFSKYVHEHLLQHAREVERLRHYVCPQCGTPVGNREVAMNRLNDWLRGGAHALRYPGGRKGITQRFNTGTRQGRKNVLGAGLVNGFFRPCGAWGVIVPFLGGAAPVPPLKRWAILGCPCGTGGGMERRVVAGHRLKRGWVLGSPEGERK